MSDHKSHEPQTKRLIVGVTGRIGAGKTSVAKYLSTAHGFDYIRYSQVLSEWRAEDAQSKTNLQAVGWEVMGGGLQVELNRRVIAQIPPRSNCAVDGLRHPTDFESLAKSFALQFFLCYVECPQQIRWQRLRSRYHEFDDFTRADSHPVEQQIETLRSKAFKVIKNDGSLQALYSQVDSLLERIHQGGQR
jgi:dephospho-CoA kinase